MAEYVHYACGIGNRIAYRLLSPRFARDLGVMSKRALMGFLDDRTTRTPRHCLAYAFARPSRSPSLAVRIASSNNATVARSQRHSSLKASNSGPRPRSSTRFGAPSVSTATRELPLLLMVWYRSVRPAALSSRRNFESLAQRGAPADRNVLSAPEPKQVRQARASFHST